ncbi:hypothetical protein [Fodinibius sp.]|uniref:hypothetical protein n=1 Tax=Fodinibius sp. TaxID=1872440 RepID=UPI002ACD2985|nr:hypothetical protein [Fodinibius sp.]MDZ7659164.1 hypothetical protein [Fodinibius sp.]
MKNSLPNILVLLLVISSWSCEQPESPDFKVTNQFEIPLTMEKTYQFLGANNALIDTTKENFEDIFDTDGEGLVRVVKEQGFNFGDLNDAIPVVGALTDTVDLAVPPSTGSQTVTASGSSSIDNNSFEFRNDSDHFVEMGRGELAINVTNGTDVAIDLEISFPEIQDPNGSPLIITLNDISANESISNSYDLAEHRIYAGEDNEIDFDITVTTKSSSSQGGQKLVRFRNR